MIKATKRRLGLWWSKLSPVVARLRPDIWTSRQWTKRSRQYWTSGWRSDPRGAVNHPSAYWAGGGEASYTSDLVPFLESRQEPLTSFLEIGCNAGRNLFHVAQHFPKASLAGIDINNEAIEFARANVPGAGGWDLRVGDLTDPSVLGAFPDDGMDIVFSMAVLVHLPPGNEKERILRECLRIARVGLLLIEPHRAGRPIWNTVPDRRMSPFSIDDYQRYLPALRAHVEVTHAGPEDPYRLLFFETLAGRVGSHSAPR